MMFWKTVLRERQAGGNLLQRFPGEASGTHLPVVIGFFRFLQGVRTVALFVG